MTKRIIQNVAIECVQGDITDQPDIHAIVNAANSELLIGGGVAGATHRAAGPGLEEECKPLAPIRPGEAVITGAHNLPNQAVIHCLGPVYGRDKPADELLATCYRNALDLADQHQAASIAFPALSTGAFGFPMELAARIAVEAVYDAVSGLSVVRLVRFVLFDEESLQAHERVLGELA